MRPERENKTAVDEAGEEVPERTAETPFCTEEEVIVFRFVVYVVGENH
jgi:hypothetical protein